MNTTFHLNQWADSREQARSFYMAVLDEKERITFVNAPFFRTFRVAIGTVGKKEFAKLMHPVDAARVSVALNDSRQQQAPATVAARVRNNPYQWIQWQISGYPGTEDGRLLCLGEDISIIQAQQEERARLGRLPVGKGG
jgi:hypothetical protein